MATDKPGVMTFLNPEIYKCLVAFKEAQRLRSLSHAVELALGEYFGIAITPITLHQAVAPTDQPMQLPKTLADRIDHLTTGQVAIYRAVVHLQQMTELLLAQHAITLPVLDAQSETTAALKGSPDWFSALDVGQANWLLENQDKPLSPLTTSTTVSEYVVPAAVARKGLTGLQLAKRLRVHSSVISRKKQKIYFKTWTSQLDPIGLGWRYVPVTRRFHPADR